MTLDKLSISPGNTKVGKIPSVSLPPVKTCPKGIPCSGECYVVRNMYGGRYGKNIRKAYERNLRILRSGVNEYFSQVRQWLDGKQKPVPFFRWHVSGDIPSREYLRGMIALAEDYPGTKFLSFTKNHAILPRANTLPENLTIVASQWPGWGSPVEGYPSAWMQDGTEDRIPRDAIECPGNCETCGMCWSLNSIKRDVVFAKH